MTSRLRIGFAALAMATCLFTLAAIRPIELLGDDEPVPGSTEALVDEVAAGTADAREHASLAIEYLSRVRSEADPRVIPEARALLERSLELQEEDNFAAAVGMASLGNATHDFSTSVRWARRAIEINPSNSGPYGLLGDALFELGRTERADVAYQKMIDLRPDVGSYVRASYAAQSHGRYRAALRALELAAQAAGPAGEEAAWIQHQLGDVYATLGRYEMSERVNRIGTRMAPGYVPPTVGIAESYIARGRYAAALPLMQRAVRNLPALEYFVTLGDVYWALGDRESAQRTYDAAARRFALYRSNGVLPDHDFIGFYADHGYRLRAALKEARLVYDNRPTPAAADTLAWALHVNGRDRAAMRLIEDALRLTTPRDATVHFHAAVIADALGEDDAARRYARTALRLDPRFSLWHIETAHRLARR